MSDVQLEERDVQDNPHSQTAGKAPRRSLVLVALIVLVTLFWVLMLAYTNLPTTVLAAIAVLSIALLSVATAWTAMALPARRGKDSAS
jgi:uncharacterized membrane protein YhaH (DUF805 family)